MTNQTAFAETTDSLRRIASRIGFWSAVLVAVVAAVSFAIAVVTPPISGPYCLNGCVRYPYTNIASFVPHDYIWMYPGFLLAPIFVVLMVCIHNYASDNKKIFSQIGLSFTLIYAVVIMTDYYIQLAVIQPSLLRGEAEGVALFTQYNPHGIFIALEDLGYLMMSLAFLFTAPVFVGNKRLVRAIRWLFIISSLVVIGAFIVMHALYWKDIGYRFEVIVITINWTVLIVAGVLLSVLFRRVARQRAP